MIYSDCRWNAKVPPKRWNLNLVAKSRLWEMNLTPLYVHIRANTLLGQCDRGVVHGEGHGVELVNVFWKIGRNYMGVKAVFYLLSTSSIFISSKNIGSTSFPPHNWKVLFLVLGPYTKKIFNSDCNLTWRNKRIISRHVLIKIKTLTIQYFYVAQLNKLILS